MLSNHGPRIMSAAREVAAREDHAHEALSIGLDVNCRI